jgi:hypothetical protein
MEVSGLPMCSECHSSVEAYRAADGRMFRARSELFRVVDVALPYHVSEALEAYQPHERLNGGEVCRAAEVITAQVLELRAAKLSRVNSEP